MAYRKFLIVCFLLACSSAFAGYAQLKPPAGWAANAYQAAANDASFINGIRSSAGLTTNVGGRAVTIPVAFRYAANAGSVAARAAFLNPWAIAGVAVGSAAYTWYTSGGYELVDGTFRKRDPSLCYSSPCYEYQAYSVNTWHSTNTAACNAAIGRYYYSAYITGASVSPGSSYCSFTTNNGSTGGYQMNRREVSPSTGQAQPVSIDQFEADHINLPIPAGLPQILPVPLPVEQPIVNPSPDPSPVSQPMRVPVGEPVSVPNTDPQQWRTPVVDIVPAPTPNDPWRVDMQPKDIIKTDPTPLPDSQPVPAPNPDTQETPSDEPAQDLCEKNPDILACQKIDEVEDSDLPEINRDVTINPGSGWGGAGSCPATKHITVQGRDIPIPIDLICQYMSGLRPIIIAMAWLSAGFILLGARGGD